MDPSPLCSDYVRGEGFKPSEFRMLAEAIAKTLKDWPAVTHRNIEKKTHKDPRPSVGRGQSAGFQPQAGGTYA